MMAFADIYSIVHTLFFNFKYCKLLYLIFLYFFDLLVHLFFFLLYVPIYQLTFNNHHSEKGKGGAGQDRRCMCGNQPRGKTKSNLNKIKK